VIRAVLAALLTVALATAAAAQSPREQRGATPGRFDFYVLALSWSPAYCALDDRPSAEQCGADAPRGFVLHGLWPQFARGYPTECDDARRPPRDTVRAAVPPFPTEGLARYQWRRHGVCSGLDATSYFRAARAAFAAVKFPEGLARGGRDEISPQEIERLFAAADPRLSPAKMSVQCRQGALTEVRICLAKDLSGPVACPEVDRDTCRRERIGIIPARD
jgi:ribonuclease T2